MGQLLSTDQHIKYILVISDYFTKWLETFALPDHKAVNVLHFGTTGCNLIVIVKPGSIENVILYHQSIPLYGIKTYGKGPLR